MSAPSRADIESLAASARMPASRLSDFLSNGGRLSFAAGADGGISAQDPIGGKLSGLPFLASGMPDFDRIIAEGGTVTGALPGGNAGNTTYYGRHTTVEYAAEVSLGDGSPPRFVKGGGIDSDGTDNKASTFAFVGNLLQHLRELPNSMDEARERGYARPVGYESESGYARPVGYDPHHVDLSRPEGYDPYHVDLTV